MLVVISILGLFLWLGQKKATNPQNELTKNELIKTEGKTEKEKNQLQMEEAFYDFGRISMKNGLVNKNFTVTNQSDTKILLSSITTSCMCTKAYLIDSFGTEKGPFGMPGHGGVVPKVNEVIESGESRDIKVVYDPNAHGPAGVGVIDRFVYLEDANGKILELEIKANVTP